MHRPFLLYNAYWPGKHRIFYASCYNSIDNYTTWLGSGYKENTFQRIDNNTFWI